MNKLHANIFGKHFETTFLSVTRGLLYLWNATFRPVLWIKWLSYQTSASSPSSSVRVYAAFSQPTRLLTSHCPCQEPKGARTGQNAHKPREITNTTWRNVALAPWTPRAPKSPRIHYYLSDLRGSDAQDRGMQGRGIYVRNPSESRATGPLRPLWRDSEAQTTCFLVPLAITRKKPTTRIQVKFLLYV